MPEIDKKVEKLVSRGRYMVPGYKVSFSGIWVDLLQYTDTFYRRNLAIFRCYRCPLDPQFRSIHVLYIQPVFSIEIGESEIII